MSARSQGGFTLIELLVVLLIMGALITLAPAAFHRIAPGLEMKAATREVAPPGQSTQVWGQEFGSISEDCKAGSVQSMAETDFLPFLLDVKVPTAVLHGRFDERIPYEACQALADGIPGARHHFQ